MEEKNMQTKEELQRLSDELRKLKGEIIEVLESL
jgi:hypothetical protein